jgi:hypothetical protein
MALDSTATPVVRQAVGDLIGVEGYHAMAAETVERT